MTEEFMKLEIRRIEAAGLRTFKNEHIPILYHDLKNIDENKFKNYVSEYIEMENPPRSFTGWTLKRFREDNIHSEREKEQSWKNSYDSSYTQEQSNMFLRCVSIAMQVFRGTGHYGTWVEMFNSGWMNKNGKTLDEFLKQNFDELSALEK